MLATNAAMPAAATAAANRRRGQQRPWPNGPGATYMVGTRWDRPTRAARWRSGRGAQPLEHERTEDSGPEEPGGCGAAGRRRRRCRRRAGDTAGRRPSGAKRRKKKNQPKRTSPWWASTPRVRARKWWAGELLVGSAGHGDELVVAVGLLQRVEVAAAVGPGRAGQLGPAPASVSLSMRRRRRDDGDGRSRSGGGFGMTPPSARRCPEGHYLRASVSRRGPSHRRSVPPWP